MTKAKLMETMNIEDVCKAAHCSRRHVEEEIKRGLLKASKPGKELVFFPEDVEKWIKRKSAS